MGTQTTGERSKGGWIDPQTYSMQGPKYFSNTPFVNFVKSADYGNDPSAY